MSSTRVAYLGPEGTFAHQAVARIRAAGPGARAEPRPTVVSVLEAVEDGEADFGVVPFENSVEGQVNLTVDVLVHDSGLPVRETSSTAEACRLVAEGDDPALVAVASPTAAQRWGLEAIATGVEDFPGAQTRFVVVGHEAADRSGCDRTMAVLTPPDDRAGVLLAALQHLSGRALNLSAIASRPLRARLGEYCFLVIIDAHLDDQPVAEAFAALRADGFVVKVLGAYPQWAG